MKNILVISSSPRLNGNSDILCDNFIRGAQENGIDSLGVLYGYGDLAEHTGAGATYIAENVADILKYV